MVNMRKIKMKFVKQICDDGTGFSLTMLKEWEFRRLPHAGLLIIHFMNSPILSFPRDRALFAINADDMENREQNADIHVVKRVEEKCVRIRNTASMPLTRPRHTLINLRWSLVFYLLSVSDRKSHWCRKRTRQNQTLPLSRFFFCTFFIL